MTIADVLTSTKYRVNGNVVTLNAENFTGIDVMVINLAGDFAFDALDGHTLDSIIVNGNSSGKTFTVSGDVNITAEVVALIIFNDTDPTKATAITIGGVRLVQR